MGTVAYYFVNDLLCCTREPTLFERLTSFSCWVQFVVMTDMSGVHEGIDERVAAQLKALKVASAEAERMGAAAQAFLDGANEVVGQGSDPSGRVSVRVDSAGRVVEVSVDGVVDSRIVSAYEDAIADRGAQLADVASDAYGPDSQVAKALLEQYGSARESAGKESHVPRVVGGVLRGRMPERNPYRRGQW